MKNQYLLFSYLWKSILVRGERNSTSQVENLWLQRSIISRNETPVMHLSVTRKVYLHDGDLFALDINLLRFVSSADGMTYFPRFWGFILGYIFLRQLWSPEWASSNKVCIFKKTSLCCGISVYWSLLRKKNPFLKRVSEKNPTPSSLWITACHHLANLRVFEMLFESVLKDASMSSSDSVS